MGGMGLQTAVYILTYLGACIYNINNNEYILRTDFLILKEHWRYLCLHLHLKLHVCLLSHFSCIQLFVTPWTVAHLAPLSVGFSRQEYCSGLPFPSPGDLPDSGLEPSSLASPVSSGGLFTTSATWEFLHLYPHLLLSHLRSHGILSIPLSSLSQKSSVVPQLPFENSCLGPVVTQLNSHSKEVHQEQIALENQLEQPCPVTMLRPPSRFLSQWVTSSAKIFPLNVSFLLLVIDV